MLSKNTTKPGDKVRCIGYFNEQDRLFVEVGKVYTFRSWYIPVHYHRRWFSVDGVGGRVFDVACFESAEENDGPQS